MLWRQFIDDITTSVKATSSDGYLPSRYIYYEAQNITSDFLRKDNDAKKKLSRLQDGWSSIECIDLQEVHVIECADIDVRLCDKMMKSVNRLPNMYTYSYGNIIDHIASPNFSYFFDPVTPRQWNNIQKRKYKDLNKYYYFILDNYIYFPIPKSVDLPMENVRMKAYFMDKWEVDKFVNIADCGNCKREEVCKSPLDYEMVIPSYLIADVKKELLNRLLGSYFKLSQDNYPNLNNLEPLNNNDIQKYGAP